MSELIPEESTPIIPDDMLEQAVLAAIMGTSGFPVDVEVAGRDGPVKAEINVRWPNAREEGEIAMRATEYLGVSPDLATQADYSFSRGRAVLEVLAVKPYPPVLQRLLVRGPDGREYLDTANLKSRELPQKVWVRFNELKARFQYLAF